MADDYVDIEFKPLKWEERTGEEIEVGSVTERLPEGASDIRTAVTYGQRTGRVIGGGYAGSARERAQREMAQEAARIRALRLKREEDLRRQREKAEKIKAEAERQKAFKKQQAEEQRREVIQRRAIKRFLGARAPEKGLIISKGKGEQFVPFVPTGRIERGTIREQPEKVVEPATFEEPERKIKPELDVVEEIEVARKETEKGKIPPIPSEAFISRHSTISPVKDEKVGLIPSASRFASEQRSFLQAEESRQGTTIKSTVLGLGVGALASAVKTGEFAVSLATEPTKTAEAVLLGIPKIPEQLGKLGSIIRREPAFVTGFIGGEIIQAKLTGRAIRKTGEFIQRVRTELSPRFRPLRVERGKEFFEVPSDVPDEALRIEIAPPLKRLKEPLSKQVRLAGRRVDVVSAQTLKKALSKEGFKFGKLERELFFDPRGRLRMSRLGLGELQKEAKLLDVLSGDVAFRTGKRVALILEKAEIEQLPKTLRDIETALRKGKGLTPSQTARLTAFQKAPTGKFKPIGFLSTEPEVTLPAGEVIKFGKGLGATIIKGKRVELIKPAIVTSTKQAERILKASTISTKDISKISSIIETRPFISPTRISISAGISLGKLSTTVSRASRISREIISQSSPRGLVPLSVSLPSVSKKPSPKRVPSLISPRKISRPLSRKQSRRQLRRLISPPVSVPRIEKRITPPVPVPPFPLPKRRIQKKKKRRAGVLRKKDLTISEGFLTKALQLGRIEKLTRKQAKLRARRGIAPLGLRGIPIIIPDVPRRKRKRRKKKKRR